MRIRSAGLLMCLLGISACSPLSIGDFEERGPRFVLEEVFEGRLEGGGYFFDRFGGVQAQLAVEMNGRIEGQSIVVHERFRQNELTIERPIIMRRVSANRYTVECPDFVGPGTIDVHGNAIRWRYRLRVRSKESERILKFDDWMILAPDGSIMNRAFASKWGFSVGEVFMTVRKTS